MQQLSLFNNPQAFYLSLPIHRRINFKSHHRPIELIMKVITRLSDDAQEDSLRPMFTCRHGFFYNRANYNNKKKEARFVISWYEKPHVRDDRGRLIGFDEDRGNALYKTSRPPSTYDECLELLKLLNDSNDVHKEALMKPEIHLG